MNPALGRVTSRAFEISLGGGDTVRGCMWAAPTPRELIAIVHGLGEHSGRYAAFASDLVERGATVAAFDWPGHGGSPGRRGDASWTDVRDRVIPALLRALRAHVRLALPLRLFGHSMGGAMALDYALEHPATIDAVWVTAPGLRPAFRVPWWKPAGARLLHLVAPHAGIAHGLPAHGLSRDPEVIALYEADPLVHGVMSAQLYFGLAAAQARVLGTAHGLRVPAVVIAGTADPVVDWMAARAFSAAAPPGLATFVPIDGAYHELLNDLDREAVLSALCNAHRVP